MALEEFFWLEVELWDIQIPLVDKWYSHSNINLVNVTDSTSYKLERHEQLMLQTFYAKLYVNVLSASEKLYSIFLLVGSQNTSALLDSGSAISIISHSFWQSVSKDKRPQIHAYTRNPLTSASGHDLEVLCEVVLPLRIHNNEY